jgi:hypothetical protein
MPTQLEWEARIERALQEESLGVFGRGGETPIGDLSASMESVDPTAPEMQAVVRALVRAINRNAGGDAKVWKNLSNLLRLSKVPRHDLGLAVDSLLARAEPRDVEARAWLTVAATDLGRRLNATRLAGDTAVRRLFPMQWIDAAVASGELSNAAERICEALGQREIKGSDLIVRLPGWNQRLQDRLGSFVALWLARVPDAEDQEKIRHWLERRGIHISAADRPQQPIAAVGNAPVIKEVHFIEDAVRRTASLDDELLAA